MASLSEADHSRTAAQAPRNERWPRAAPVICGHRPGHGFERLDVMRWGLVPFWAKDIKVGFANINAKAEGIEGKPAFREAFQRRRCLVPVDNFYEWVRREVVCVIVRRRHPAGPAVPSAVPYEVGRVGDEPSKSPRTMYPAVTTGTETARGRYFCQHQGG